MAEVQEHEGEGIPASSSTSASVSVSASSSISASVPVSASTSTSVSVLETASPSTYVSVPVTASPSTSVSVPINASSSTSVSVLETAFPSTSLSIPVSALLSISRSVPVSAFPSTSAVSVPVSASSSTPESASSSNSASVAVASSASAYASALASASACTSPSSLAALSELAAAAWATESASATCTTRATESTSTSSLVAWTLTDELPIKLEGVINLVAWKQQVMRVLINENLLEMVISPVTPIKYANQLGDVVREEYEEWVTQDEKVRIWLLSSLSEFMCSFVTGWEHAWEVWSAVHEICRTELIDKIKIALRAEIKKTKKENQSVTEYVSRITSLISALVGLGDEVSEHEHVEAILEGLPEEYESLRAIIRARSEHATVSHLESLMLIQETLINNLNSRLPLHSVLPLGNLHLDDGAGRGRGSGSAQGGGRGRRQGGGRRRDGGHGGSN